MFYSHSRVLIIKGIVWLKLKTSCRVILIQLIRWLGIFIIYIEMAHTYLWESPTSLSNDCMVLIITHQSQCVPWPWPEQVLKVLTLELCHNHHFACTVYKTGHQFASCLIMKTVKKSRNYYSKLYFHSFTVKRHLIDTYLQHALSWL